MATFTSGPMTNHIRTTTSGEVSSLKAAVLMTHGEEILRPNARRPKALSRPMRRSMEEDLTVLTSAGGGGGGGGFMSRPSPAPNPYSPAASSAGGAAAAAANFALVMDNTMPSSNGGGASSTANSTASGSSSVATSPCHQHNGSNHGNSNGCSNIGNADNMYASLLANIPAQVVDFCATYEREVIDSADKVSRLVKALSYSSAPIKTPLLNPLPLELHHAALEIFSKILVYTGDEPDAPTSMKGNKTILSDVIQIANDKAFLPAELLCQVLKQTTNVPNLAKAELCWEVFIHVLTSLSHFLEHELLAALTAHTRAACWNADVTGGIAIFCYHYLTQIERGTMAQCGWKRMITEQEMIEAKAAYMPGQVFGVSIDAILRQEYYMSRCIDSSRRRVKGSGTGLEGGIAPVQVYTGDTVPDILQLLCHIIEYTLKGSQEVGVFRRAGDTDVVQSLIAESRAGDYHTFRRLKAEGPPGPFIKAEAAGVPACPLHLNLNLNLNITGNNKSIIDEDDNDDDEDDDDVEDGEIFFPYQIKGKPTRRSSSSPESSPSNRYIRQQAGGAGTGASRYRSGSPRNQGASRSYEGSPSPVNQAGSVSPGSRQSGGGGGRGSGGTSPSVTPGRQGTGGGGGVSPSSTPSSSCKHGGTVSPAGSPAAASSKQGGNGHFAGFWHRPPPQPPQPPPPSPSASLQQQSSPIQYNDVDVDDEDMTETHHHRHHHAPQLLRRHHRRYRDVVRDVDCLVAADLLRLWLRSIPDLMGPGPVYQQALAAGMTKDVAKAVQVLESIPLPNRATIQCLITFLKRFDECYSKDTSMTAISLATVFAPNLTTRTKTRNSSRIVYGSNSSANSYGSNSGGGGGGGKGSDVGNAMLLQEQLQWAAETEGIKQFLILLLTKDKK